MSSHERLREQCGREFAVLDTLAEFSALEDLPRVFPAAYVIPGGEEAEPSPQIKTQHQTHTAVVQLFYLWRHAGDTRGAKGLAGLHRLREFAHDALVGWIPPESGGHRIQFVRGALEGAKDGVVTWVDSFAVRRIVSRTPS